MTFLVTLTALAWALAFGDASAGQDLTSLTNSDRASNGRRALATASDLQSFAQRRAEAMASQQRLYHTQNLGQQVSNWRKLGENVGRGRSLEEIEASYMGSAPHRENILSSDFTQVGVGVAVNGPHIYTAVIFRLPANSSSASAAAAPAPPPPAPKPAPKPAPVDKAAAPKPAPAPATSAPPPPPPPAPEPPPAPPATEPPPAPVEAPPVPVETAPPSTSAIQTIDEWKLYPPIDPPMEMAAGFISDLSGDSEGVPGALAASGVASLVGAWALFGAVIRHRRVEASLTRLFSD